MRILWRAYYSDKKRAAIAIIYAIHFFFALKVYEIAAYDDR
jgi:hypothetical protein